MTARTLPAPARRWAFLLTALLAALPGCQGVGGRHDHAAKHIPQYGVIDPNQSRELQMVSLPPYVVEPPDELEVSIRPAPDDFPTTPLTVRSDGNIDLGFLGNVYVAGLTLEQVELKIAQHLGSAAGPKRPSRPYQVSVRLTDGTHSKTYYVLGTVVRQERFPITGHETVLDGILAAGLKSNSLPEKAYLVRPHPAGGPDQVLKIDWIGINQRGDTLTNYQLFPGDRIIVPGGKPPSLLRSLVGG